MKKQFFAFFSLFLLVANLAVAAIPVPAAPKLAASSWILMDYSSGKVLAEKDADTRIEPASITKVMTSYVVYQALEQGLISLEDEVIISEKAWRMGGSRMFVEVGKSVSVNDLIHGLVIQSGNDAAVALAEHVAGTEEAFADQMNVAAAQIGMKNSQFRNATGWPHPDHYVTARDVAIMSQALIRDFPEHYAINAQKEYTFNGIKQPNRNRLLWRDSSVDGIKTGHTDAAGYCLASSAKRGDMRLISIIMGTKSDSARAKASQTLLNYGFRFFETHKLYSAGETVQQLKVWKGDKEALNIGPSEDVFVIVPRGQYKNLNLTLEGLPNPAEAPINKAQALGTIQATLDGEVVVSAPAVALSQVNEGSFFSRAMDSILLMFE